MTVTSHYHVLKKISPLAILPGGGLLIIASGRLAHAVAVVGALIWVYGLTSLAIYASGIYASGKLAGKIFPRHGRTVLFFFLASFMAGCYLFLLWLLSPLCALEVFFAVSLIPVFYIASGVSGRFDVGDNASGMAAGKAAISAEDSFFSSFYEALSLGVLLLAFALIREPLGFVSLSLPGGAQGSVMLFSFNPEFILPIQLISSSSGALLLLGYFWGWNKLSNKVQEEDKNAK